MYSEEEFRAKLQRDRCDLYHEYVKNIIKKFSLRIATSELTPQNVLNMIVEAYVAGVDDVAKILEITQAKMVEYEVLSALLNNKNMED